MPTLSTSSINVLLGDIMHAWSQEKSQTPINKTQLRALLVLIDTGLDDAEVSIISSLPAGQEKTWLIANPTIGRRVLEETARRRRRDL